MIKICYKYAATYILFCIVLASCTKEVDFDQANDLSLNPVVASNLIYFKANASDFSVDTTELTTVKDSVIIDLFGRNFFIDYVVKAEFVFEVTNSINRRANITIEFFDINDQKRHEFSILTPASPNNLDIVTTHTEVFENNSLNALKASDKVVLTMQFLAGGDLLNMNTPGRIELKSKGVFYTTINDL
ncbi:hypothetical protein [Aestuariivivens sediminis]|uniref:hypothetical protein n=1 Tax=Aestuariivivens sediminis TaxID=2913557 RepID=UPI001F5683D2|nr:hypothetical protein [Aestuariivivens sediminis]